MSPGAAREKVRVATPDNEEELVEVARHSTAAQMERPVSAWNRSDRADARVLVAEAALGEGFGKVMEGDEASSTTPVPVVGRAKRYQVVVHVSAETLAGAGDVSAETPGRDPE